MGFELGRPGSLLAASPRAPRAGPRSPGPQAWEASPGLGCESPVAAAALAAGVVHDLRSALASLLWQLHGIHRALALGGAPTPAPSSVADGLPELRTRTDEALARLAGLADALALLCHDGEIATTVDLRELAAAAYRLARPVVARLVVPRLTVSDEPVLVLGRPAPIVQAMMGLLFDGAEAAPPCLPLRPLELHVSHHGQRARVTLSVGAPEAHVPSTGPSPSPRPGGPALLFAHSVAENHGGALARTCLAGRVTVTLALPLSRPAR